MMKLFRSKLPTSKPYFERLSNIVNHYDTVAKFAPFLIKKIIRLIDAVYID